MSRDCCWSAQKTEYPRKGKLTLVIWVGRREKSSLNWCVDRCAFFCSSDPWWQCDFVWLRVQLSHLLCQIWKSQCQKMGHLQCPYGDELLGMSWVDLVPESGVGTNQGIQISTLLYHRSLLCCSLTVETKRSYKWSLDAFGRTPGYSALLWTLLLRKKLNKKKLCFTKSCPLLLLTDEFAKECFCGKIECML